MNKIKKYKEFINEKSLNDKKTNVNYICENFIKYE